MIIYAPAISVALRRRRRRSAPRPPVSNLPLWKLLLGELVHAAKWPVRRIADRRKAR